MKIFIYGGSGYLGSVLTTRLITEGHQVTVYDNLKYKQNSLVDLAHHNNFNFVYTVGCSVYINSHFFWAFPFFFRGWGSLLLTHLGLRAGFVK